MLSGEKDNKTTYLIKSFCNCMTWWNYLATWYMSVELQFLKNYAFINIILKFRNDWGNQSTSWPWWKMTHSCLWVHEQEFCLPLPTKAKCFQIRNPRKYSHQQCRWNGIKISSRKGLFIQYLLSIRVIASLELSGLELSNI